MKRDLFLEIYVRVKSFFCNEKGQALAEYGLIIALIAIVCITALSGLGTQISNKFRELITALSQNASQTGN